MKKSDRNKKKARDESKKKKKVVRKKKVQSKSKDQKSVSEHLPLEEAIKILRAVEILKPTASYELFIKTELDKSSGGVTIPRGRINLPREPKEKKKDIILVFADGKVADQARKAGAQHVGGVELIEDLLSGKLKPNIILSTPGLLRPITPKLGRFLGPKGLMPSPRRGTVTEDIRGYIQRTVGSNEWKADKSGTIRSPMGKIDWPSEDIVKNVKAYVSSVLKATTRKGQNQSSSDKSAFSRMLAKRQGKEKTNTAIKKVVLSSSHGPGFVLSDVIQ